MRRRCIPTVTLHLQYFHDSPNRFVFFICSLDIKILAVLLILITYALLRIKLKQTTNLRSIKVHYYDSFTICVVLGHISNSDVGQLQTEDARNKWGKQFAESFLEKPLRVLF